MYVNPKHSRATLVNTNNGGPAVFHCFKPQWLASRKTAAWRTTEVMLKRFDFFFGLVLCSIVCSFEDVSVEVFAKCFAYSCSYCSITWHHSVSSSWVVECSCKGERQGVVLDCTCLLNAEVCVCATFHYSVIALRNAAKPGQWPYQIRNVFQPKIWRLEPFGRQSWTKTRPVRGRSSALHDYIYHEKEHAFVSCTIIARVDFVFNSLGWRAVLL